MKAIDALRRLQERDVHLIGALKLTYFTLLKREDYPRTPDVTRDADTVEGTIRQLQAEVQERAQFLK